MNPARAATTLRLEELHHRDPAVAAAIGALMRAAYRVEGALLGRADFPPAARSDAEVRGATSVFVGARRTPDDALLGVAEYELDDQGLLLAALTVDPAHQRRGVGRALVAEVSRRAAGRPVRVATARANHPALALYAAAGFRPEREWTTACGLAMVTLARA